MKNSSGNLRASAKELNIKLRWLLAPIFLCLAPKLQQKLPPLLSAACSTQWNQQRASFVPAGNLFALGKSIKFQKTRTHTACRIN